MVKKDTTRKNTGASIFTLVAVTMALCLAATAFAADGTWNGPAGGDLCEPSNWSPQGIPTGAATISVASATTLTCSGEFSPSSITFGADSALVTISGTGCVTNILAITNSVALHHVFNIPVTFPGATEADIPLGTSDYIVFSGGMTAYALMPKLDYGVDSAANAVYAYVGGRVTLTKENDDYDSAVKGLYQIPNGSTLTLNGAVNSGYASFRLATGAMLIIDGDFVSTKEDNGWSFICYQNHHSGGTIKINGKIYVNNPTNHLAPYHRANNYTKESGKFYASGLVVSGKDRFYLNGRKGDDVTADGDKSTAITRWYIGRDGLSSSGTGNNFSIPKSAGGASLTAMEDFAISAPISISDNSSLAIVTTNPETRENHKVTISAALKSTSGAAVTVSGSGEVLYTTSANQAGTLTVNGAATVSANAGIKPNTGPVNLNDTSTLKVAQSGTMLLAGLLTAASGTTIAFNFTDPTTPPTINAAGGLTLPESGTVKVKVTADGDNLAIGTHTLVSGAGLTEGDLAKFSMDRNLTDDLRGSLSVSGGSLVLTVSPKPGAVLYIR